MEIIALSGFARSGKDEAARVLVEKFGFVQVAFADKLREMLYALNPIVEYKFLPPYTENTGQHPHTKVYVQDVIDVYGWGSYKESPYGPEIRRLLQRLGTEAGRQTLWDSIWIDAALTGLDEDARVCIADCRFQNEAEAIRSRGGKIVRVTRAGVKAANAHISEHDLDDFDFDYYLSNDGTLDEYHRNVARFANEIGL